MASHVTPRQGPFQVIFVDIPANTAVDAIFTSTTSFADFLTLLCDLSGSVAERLENLPQPRVSGQGLTLIDGCWWYRFARRSVETPNTSAAPQVKKSSWKVLDNSFGFDRLMAEMTLGITTQDGWVEVQHDQQKQRDEFIDTRYQLANRNWQTDLIPTNTINLQHTESSSSTLAESSSTRHPGTELCPVSEGTGNSFLVSSQPVGDISTSHSPSIEDLSSQSIPPYVGPLVVNGANSPSHVRSASIMSTSTEQFPDLPQLELPVPGDVVLADQNFLQYPYQSQPGYFGGPQNGYAVCPRPPSAPLYQQRYSYNPQNINQRQPTFGGPSHFLQPQGSKNNYNQRGGSRGRVGLPSFTPRPAPFPAQIGTPRQEVHAQWKVQHQKELEREDAELEAERYQNAAFVDNSQDAQGRQGRDESRKKKGSQDPRPEFNSHGGPQNGSGYHGSKRNQSMKQNSSRTSTQSSGFYAYGSGHQSQPRQYYQQGSSQFDGGYQATPYSGYDVQYRAPSNTSASQHNPNALYGDSVYGAPPEPMPYFDYAMMPENNAMYAPTRPDVVPSSAMHPEIPGGAQAEALNTDLMTESEIIALSEANTDVRAVSSGKWNPYHDPSLMDDNLVPPQAVGNPVQIPHDRYSHHSYTLPKQGFRHPVIGTLAATYNSADEFNTRLERQLQPEQVQQRRASPGIVKQLAKSSKSNNKGNSTSTYWERMKDNTNQIAPQSRIAPPVGDFSPPKPRDVREERAKKTFEARKKDHNDKQGRTSRNSNVGAKATKARQKSETRSTQPDKIKFGFDSIEDAQKDFDHNDNRHGSDSELSSLSPSPTLDSETLSHITSSGAQHSQNAEEDAQARRLRMREANKAKEKAEKARKEKSEENRVAKQKEGRAARAQRRASVKEPIEGDL